MPYLITVKPDACPWGMAECRCAGHTRAVVSELDERVVATAVFNWRPGDALTVRELQVVEQIERLPADGGTITLFDGTVITVERAGTLKAAFTAAATGALAHGARNQEG